MSSATNCANALRVLAMDAVQKANSGHPGMPMGMADIAQVLWQEFLSHHPRQPQWLNRDRFVISNGHGSMLLYALLHLSGYDMSMEDLKQFRQLHSKTPGHPEYGCAPGVETTTGPLGQGIANAVGMALAERTLALEFNRPNFSIIDHMTYVFAGDGCMMEGISHEASSLAGTLGLGKLIVFYDDNDISIDGQVSGWFADDTVKRFEGYHWQVIPNVDGHDPQAVRDAITQAKACENKPTLICCKTIIAYGAPNKAGTHEAHGAPLGEEEVKAVRKQLGWTFGPFEIPQDIYQAWDACEAGETRVSAWESLFNDYKTQYSNLAHSLERRIHQTLPENWVSVIKDAFKKLSPDPKPIATRKASLWVLNEIAHVLPEFLGGSADLTGSNLTAWEGCTTITPTQPAGNYIHYGVREFGMAAIMNGLALHGGYLPFGGTFLVFSDYARNAVRLSALMGVRVIYVFSHDSIGLGEDGPTHQPIEHLTSLRAMPNMTVWRPCDTIETLVAWQCAIETTSGPSSLCLTRQSVPQYSNDTNAIARGAYILKDVEGEPDMLLMATGSEVSLAMSASALLGEKNIKARVISMPCVERFLEQDQVYQDTIFPRHIKHRIAIEAGSTGYWYRFVGLEGCVIGLDRFGESAPGDAIYKALKLTGDTIVNVAEMLMQK